MRFPSVSSAKRRREGRKSRQHLGLPWAMLHTSTHEILSGISGSVSLACWLFVLAPQLIENYMSKSADGISMAFLIVWLVVFSAQYPLIRTIFWVARVVAGVQCSSALFNGSYCTAKDIC